MFWRNFLLKSKSLDTIVPISSTQSHRIRSTLRMLYACICLFVYSRWVVMVGCVTSPIWYPKNKFAFSLSILSAFLHCSFIIILLKIAIFCSFSTDARSYWHYGTLMYLDTRMIEAAIWKHFVSFWFRLLLILLLACSFTRVRARRGKKAANIIISESISLDF